MISMLSPQWLEKSSSHGERLASKPESNVNAAKWARALPSTGLRLASGLLSTSTLAAKPRTLS